jgi:antitoxin component YwqK of YwqJK toxin-antitoxin module
MAQRTFIKIYLLLSVLLFGCSQKTDTKNPEIISMQTIDRNGFSETISSKDRLKGFAKVNFLSPQPYQKVLRVYPRNDQGQSISRITSYHPNGHIWQYLEITEGRAHGVYQEWYANSQLKIEAHVMEGLAEVSDSAQGSWLFDKTSKVWDEQGRLIAEFFYEKGVLQGNSVHYHPNGQAAKLFPYANNELDGLVSIFSTSGELLELIPFQKGVKEGCASGKATDGSWTYSESYSQGNLLEATYHSIFWNPLPKVEKGEGYQLIFKENQLDKIIEIHEGMPIGTVRQLHPDGSLHSLYHITKEGMKEGEEILFYPSKRLNDLLELPPQKKLSFFWHDDSIQGKVRSWYENGILESEKEMSQNRKQGPSLAYYEDGKLMLSEEYDRDKLINGTYFKRKEKKPVSRVEQGSGIATIHFPDGRFKKKISYEKGLPLLEND